MSKPILNYYEVLGLNQSATSHEIRRAYRILARRYHPDLNPGKSSEDRFKTIASAYQTLSDSDKKRQYDSEIDSAKRIKAGFAAYEKAQQAAKTSKAKNFSNRTPSSQQSDKSKSKSILESDIASGLFSGFSKAKSFFTKKPALENSSAVNRVNKISVIEVSIGMQDALFGGRKAIEVPGETKTRKISLRIPAGVRTGSVLRLRSGAQNKEEFVIILRVAPHPLIELPPKGVLVDLPVSISEALLGATIKAPGLDQEETLIIPPGSQSGQEIRLTSRGVKFEDGQRGDIFYRLNIQIPTSLQAVGLKEKVESVNQYYETSVRQNFPSMIKGLAS